MSILYDWAYGILLWQREWTNTTHKADNIYSSVLHGKRLTPLPVKKL